MGLIELVYDEGQTPLNEEEKEGLLIKSVTTKGELDEVEQHNIESAIRWTIERNRKFTSNEILTEQFVLGLHKRMFGAVWDWAGTFRRTDKNIGVSKFVIGVNLKSLLDDCKYWIENKTYSPDEIAIRFKHRLVSIHCFANGNGRHSRLMADIIIEKVFNEHVFTWGRNNLAKQSTERTTYLSAIREADKGNLSHLIAFARS